MEVFIREVDGRQHYCTVVDNKYPAAVEALEDVHNDLSRRGLQHKWIKESDPINGVTLLMVPLQTKRPLSLANLTGPAPTQTPTRPNGERFKCATCTWWSFSSRDNEGYATCRSPHAKQTVVPNLRGDPERGLDVGMQYHALGDCLATLPIAGCSHWVLDAGAMFGPATNNNAVQPLAKTTKPKPKGRIIDMS